MAKHVWTREDLGQKIDKKWNARLLLPWGILHNVTMYIMGPRVPANSYVLSGTINLVR